jgi:hypothetical protein
MGEQLECRTLTTRPDISPPEIPLMAVSCPRWRQQFSSLVLVTPPLLKGAGYA